MKIYLDMCCYNRPYDDQTQMKIALETQAKLYIQQLIRERCLNLVGSYTLDYECSNVPVSTRKEARMKFINDNVCYHVSVERNEIISKKAALIMTAGVKEKDAYHLASAIYAECEYFISTDLRLLKYKTDEIKMVTPIEFIIKLEGD
ncbi:MAG: hypothetical protein IJ859_04615 [Synergistaceae bacterium]|nr:hypothetical protein [Synergistaceae bacterium]